MRYVDGFVIAIPKKNLKAYKQMAAVGGKVWMKHGALQYVEAIGEDLLSVKQWGGLPFPDMAKTKKGEIVVFSYIVYKSRKHRDQVNAKVHKDPFMNQDKYKTMPFEMSRMAYGGFTTLVDL
jgi:alkaline phosphatase